MPDRLVDTFEESENTTSATTILERFVAVSVFICDQQHRRTTIDCGTLYRDGFIGFLVSVEYRIVPDGTITSKLGQDQFLQLLVAQLKSQDPLEPVNNQEYLGQLAQFSTLSGIEKLNANFGDMLSLQQLTQGANLVGGRVSYLNSDGSSSSGIVEGLTMKDGKVNLTVNGTSVLLSQITGLTAS